MVFYLQVLCRHNGANQTQNRVDLLRLKREAQDAMDELETLKDSEELFDTFRRKMTAVVQCHLDSEQLPSAPSLSQLQPSIQQDIKQQFQWPRGLRRIIVNRRLVDEFLPFAYEHLQHNVEFCGILAGRLTPANTLQVTHLLIPKQEGTSDACHALNEDDLFRYQHSNDLLTLGWIHTHPSQSAFLSSVDLKTHYGYQLMMDESIAIVCAPRHSPSLGIFRITDSGMNRMREILHSNPNWSERRHEQVGEILFEKCNHVTCSYDVDAPANVVDLR